MCNLYSETRAVAAVRDLFKVSPNRAAVFEPRNAIFPGKNAPVVRKAADGAWELLELNWGFVLPQQGKAARRVTNVRDDNIDSRFWRESFEQRRCLVPATSFCEPDGKVSPASWNWFALKRDEPRAPFAFAGIWRSWRGPVKKDGPVVEMDVYSFFTTLPNSVVERVNHERMPVILDNEADWLAWMDGPPAAARKLLRTYPAERLHLVQTGYEKQDLEAA
ncbi:SOS response-associated peptidase [Hyphomicrobium sp. CS1BSMeth3]|uniref:SOS response-associated peptidase n=1 Tax=Hyphomicrobium sp. CS1BSMeth3 TaxID=1892844 RepID=UPI0009309373|nr:SOS response-associated peptidase [Hyphomicrobium sp. CS1BSMeth3]